MNARSLVGGVETQYVALEDRGFAYGDGVFETVLVAGGKLVWWDSHVARLQRGCDVLGIACPPIDLLEREALSLTDNTAFGALKVTITRGVAARGYAAPLEPRPSRVLALHVAQPPSPVDRLDGIALRWCEMRLAVQPRLAGIKHLNRLEQVIARSEWRDTTVSEGLMRDTQGRVICATAANLFVVRDGLVLTPALEGCGVAGVCREWVMRQQPVQVREFSAEEIESADELFLTSSLRGILPVALLEGRRWAVGPMTRQLQDALWREIPALRPKGNGLE